MRRVPDELANLPECPDELLHVWIWFCQMSIPLSYTEIKCWAELTGNTPTEEEVSLLMMANQTYQKVIYD